MPSYIYGMVAGIVYCEIKKLSFQLEMDRWKRHHRGAKGSNMAVV
jgi:hypothetical protein